MVPGGPSIGPRQCPSEPPHEETGMDNDDKGNEVGRLFLWLAVAGILILILGGCTSQEARQAHQDGQVEIIRTQVDARTQQRIADATARTALYEAMARVAQTNPESSDAIAVALAVSSVREEDGGDSGPLVQLQAQRNEAVELAKAIAPALITTAGTIGVAAIQGETNRRASDNARMIAIADSAADASIMESVTGMATTGLLAAGTSIGGDYYQAETISQDQITETTTTSTTNETTTISESYNSSSSSTASADTNIADSYNEGSYNAETNSTSDSYNETTTTSDSYNETSSSDTYNTTDTYNQQTYTTTGGDSLTFDELRDLVLQGLNFTVIIDGEEVTVEPSEDSDCPDGPGLTFGGGSVVCG